MGLYRNTYLGVYLRVNVEKTIEKVVAYADEYGRPTPHKFNPDTGEPNQENHVDHKTKYDIPVPYIYDYDDLDEDMFCDTGDVQNEDYTIFTLNISGVFSKHIDEYDLESEISPTLDIPHLIKEFKETYKDYIDYYKKRYGIVTVHYGLVTYYN